MTEEQIELFEDPPFEVKPKEATIRPGVPIIPKGSRILVVRNIFRQRSVIYIPDTAQQKPTTGVVVAIGPDVPDGFVRLGEQVLFSLYAGVPYAIVDAKGEVSEYLTLDPSEIAGELIVDLNRLQLEQGA